MPLIDTTYFTGIADIAGISEEDSPVVGSSVTTTWIPRYEKEYLIAVLGYGFYSAFIAGLAVTPTPATKWTDLKNGKDYVVSGNTYRWNGFVNSDKVSPIAYYVFCHYLRDNANPTTGIGVRTLDAQNSVMVSPMQKISSAWDAMRDLNNSLWHFLENNTDTYTEYNTAMVNHSELCGGWNMFGI